MAKSDGANSDVVSTICPLPLDWNKIKVEIFLEQREVAFLSPSKICKNLNFSTEIQIFANFAG